VRPVLVLDSARLFVAGLRRLDAFAFVDDFFRARFMSLCDLLCNAACSRRILFISPSIIVRAKN
jgi:hypothetical protein